MAAIADIARTSVNDRVVPNSDIRLCARRDIAVNGGAPGRSLLAASKAASRNGNFA
jgi:hypothetical protein